MSAADIALSSIKGCDDCGKLLAVIRSGHACPDDLLATLQFIRGTGDGDRLRAFVRCIQKALETSR